MDVVKQGIGLGFYERPEEKLYVESKMMWLKFLVSALVFAAFVPGVLITLPPGGSRWVVLAVHGVLFAVLHHFVLSAVFRGLKSL